MDVSSRRLALVLHRHLAEHGLLSFLGLLGAFLLNAIKRNKAAAAGGGLGGGSSGGSSRAQCAKQPACLGLNTERPVHRTGPALLMPWSDAPRLSAHTLLVVRSVGQQEDDGRISPVVVSGALFMNTPDGQRRW